MKVTSIIARDDQGIPVPLPQLLARPIVQEIKSGSRETTELANKVLRRHYTLLHAALQEAENRLVSELSSARGQTERLRVIVQEMETLNEVKTKVEAIGSALPR